MRKRTDGFLWLDIPEGSDEAVELFANSFQSSSWSTSVRIPAAPEVDALRVERQTTLSDGRAKQQPRLAENGAARQSVVGA